MTQTTLDLEGAVLTGRGLVEDYYRKDINRIQSAINAGQYLAENTGRSFFGYGKWGPYLKDIGISDSTAQRWMSIGTCGLSSEEISEKGGINSVAEEFPFKGNSPHLAQGTGNEGWYTPDDLMDLVRAVLGEIDLDPASNDDAQQRVGAARYFTKDDDGLAQQWEGRVYLNPPYTGGLVDQFADKLVEEYQLGNVSEAIWLTNNSTDTAWFDKLASCASAVLFIRGRVKFWTLDADGTERIGAPLQGQILAYLGNDPALFIGECKARECGRGYLSVPAA